MEFPAKWTRTPTKTLSEKTSPAASERPTDLFPETEISETDTPTNTPTAVEQKFPVATDTLFTVVQGMEMFAVNWDGEETPILFIDNLVNANGNILMKRSPDQRYLAVSGIDEEQRPVVEIIDLGDIRIVKKEIFTGTHITDYSWSPDSRSLIVSELFYYSHERFDTILQRMDLQGTSSASPLFELEGTAVYQIEWGSNDHIADIEFSCQDAVEVEDPYGDKMKVGRTSLGMIDGQTHKKTGAAVSDVSEFGTSKIVVSPDGAKLVYLGFDEILETGSRKTNRLFSMDGLVPLDCPFCSGWSDIIWWGNFLLVKSGWVGIPGGAVYLAKESGTSRKLMEFETIGPDSRIYASNGKTFWIDYQSQFVGNTPVVVSDIHACLPDNANMATCRREMWSVLGDWVEGYNRASEYLDIRCHN